RRPRPWPGGYPAAPGEPVRGDSVRGDSVRGDSVRGESGRGALGRGALGRGALGSGVPEQSESERAREICLRQLATRPRTRAELAKALARQGISDEVVAEVLDRYDEVGIIDDAAFARAWVSSRHHSRGLARRTLANE